MANPQQLTKTGPDTFKGKSSSREYSKSSIEADIEQLESLIDEKEKQVGLKSLRRRLDKKKGLLAEMNKLS